MLYEHRQVSISTFLKQQNNNYHKLNHANIFHVSIEMVTLLNGLSSMPLGSCSVCLEYHSLPFTIQFTNLGLRVNDNFSKLPSQIPSPRLESRASSEHHSLVSTKASLSQYFKTLHCESVYSSVYLFKP